MENDSNNKDRINKVDLLIDIYGLAGGWKDDCEKLHSTIPEKVNYLKKKLNLFRCFQKSLQARISKNEEKKKNLNQFTAEYQRAKNIIEICWKGIELIENTNIKELKNMISEKIKQQKRLQLTNAEQKRTEIKTLAENGDQFVFKKDGDRWNIVFKGEKLPSLNHLDGFGYIQYLLSNPRKPFKANDIFYAVKGQPVQPREEYLDHLDVQSWSHISGDQIKKASSNVSQRIYKAYDKLFKSGDIGKTLRVYLSSTIKTGFTLCYSPSKSDLTVNWLTK